MDCVHVLFVIINLNACVSPLVCGAVIPSVLEMFVFFCAVTDLNGSPTVWFQNTKKLDKNTNQQPCLLTQILTWFLKNIHKPCCEQFRVGTVYYSVAPASVTF